MYTIGCQTAPLCSYKNIKHRPHNSCMWSDDKSLSNHSQSDLSSVIDWSASEHDQSEAAVTWSLVQPCSASQSVQGSRGIEEMPITTACGFEGSHWKGGTDRRRRMDSGRGTTPPSQGHTITVSHPITLSHHHHTVTSPSHQ